MRIICAFAILTSVALAHGGSGRVPATGGGFSAGGKKVPGGTTTPSGQRGGAPTTITSNSRDHNWRIWWEYNREYYIAYRLRGTPISGGRPLRDNNAGVRKRLRRDVIAKILLEALEDPKSHEVRSAAAVALGKFGDSKFDRALTRRSDAPREKWFDVKEAAIYGMGLLGLTENRGLMTRIAGDKRRPIVARSIALTSLLLDRSQGSAATLEWHLNYVRSGVRYNADQSPSNSEEDRRRFSAHLFGFARKDIDVNALLFRAALGSRKWTEATRGLAITALGRRRARDYTDRLFRMMYQRETPEPVMESIAIAMGSLIKRGDSDHIRRLASFATDFRGNPAVRHFAVMALARIGGKQCADQLMEYLRDNVFNAAEDRAFVYLALGILGHESEEARETLMEAYRKRRPITTRSVLALALGLARHKEAIPLTIRYMNNTSLGDAGDSRSGSGSNGGRSNSNRGASKPSKKNRPGPTTSKLRGAHFLAYGALALGFHGREEGLAEVRRVLKKYRDPLVESNAATALVMLRRARAMEELEPILKQSGNAVTRGAAIMALGLIPNPDLALVNLLKRQYERDSNPESVRAMAIIGLGAIGDPLVVPMSVRFIRGYNYLIRCQALDLIATLL